MSHSVYRTIKSQIKTTRLLAVSKRQPTSKIITLYDEGQRDFGENYVQEGIDKIQQITCTDIVWHYIGVIQSNKTKLIATYFDWVQSVDRLSIAIRLNHHAKEAGKTLNVCVCVNMDNEPQKSGVCPSDLIELFDQLTPLTHIKLRGLMAIPKPRKNYEAQCLVYKKLKFLFDTLNNKGYKLDTLSMGMSADYPAAIASGSTMVRIGTALFGERTS